MTPPSRTPTLTPMFTLMLCDYAEAAAIKVLGRAPPTWNNGSYWVFNPRAVNIGRIAMIMIRAALAFFALAACAAIDARSAAAEIYRPWCVQYQDSSGNGSTSCAFASYEQCMMTAGPGTGGVCVQNPWYLQYGEHGQGQGGDRRRPKRQ